MRVHPIKANNGYGIFDLMTNSVVFPLEINDGVISNETLTFTGKNKTTEVNHKLGEMIHLMNNKDHFKMSTDGETSILDCSGIFENAPFSFLKQIKNFNGIIKVNFQSKQVHLFEKVEQPVVWKWSPKSADKFEFKKEGRHPQSKHKIFSEMLEGPGHIFSEIFAHEASASIVVEDMKTGIIGNLMMNTFIGDTGKKFHRGVKTVQDMASYIFPYVWQNDEVLRISMGTNHRYKGVQFVSNLMKKWASPIAGVDYPVILNMKRGRGRNHEKELNLSITHALIDITQEG